MRFETETGKIDTRDVRQRVGMVGVKKLFHYQIHPPKGPAINYGQGMGGEEGNRENPDLPIVALV